MNPHTRILLKNLIVAATVSLAALASWAFTDMQSPSAAMAAVVLDLT